MTRATLDKLLLLALLLVILGWILYRRDSGPTGSEPVVLDAGEHRIDSRPRPPVTFEVSQLRPLPGAEVSPSEEVLQVARRSLGEGAQEGTCGPYRYLTDVTDSHILAVCERISADLDDVYRQRFGVEPVGEPAAAILMFASRIRYQDFADAEGTASAGYAGYSSTARGYCAIWADSSRPEEFARTLGHELTHLVHRRALGGALPRWLSEGLADAVGDTSTVAGIQPLRGQVGVEGEAQRLRLGLAAGRVSGIEHLVSSSDEDFDQGTVSYDYEHSALLVRFLLLETDLADGFHRFLEDLVAGEDYSPELLQARLRTEWPDLDQRFGRWLSSG